MARVTPVLTSGSVDRAAGRQVFCKAEIFQRGGAFKFRGAYNSIAALGAEGQQQGVVTHSSGNHAGAVAMAAQLLGCTAHIVAPRTAPRVKLDAVKAFGGRLTLCDPTMEAREAACQKIQDETGAHFVPPYNYGETICGQGTIALEFLEQCAGLQAIVVPVSGGGMLSGIAVAAKALEPGIRIIAAEPVGLNDAADVALCMAAGELVEVPRTRTIADGLQARLGDLTWPIVRDHVDDVITVEENEIVGGMRLCYERMKVVVEPSGAVGLAAVVGEKFAERHGDLERVGVILCGGNVDLNTRGFWESWRA